MVEHRPFKPLVQGSSPCTPILRIPEVIVLHAQWSDGHLHLWGESDPGDAGVHEAGRHPYALDGAMLRAGMQDMLPDSAAPSLLTLRLPASSTNSKALPSRNARHWLGLPEVESDAYELLSTTVPTVAIPPDEANTLLAALEAEEDWSERRVLDEMAGHEADIPCHILLADSVRYLAGVSRLIQSLLAAERIVPTVIQGREGPLHGAWEPWLADEGVGEQIALLLRSMPPALRAVEDDLLHDGAAILEAMMLTLADASCRSALDAEQMCEAIEDWDAQTDPHVAWLSGLLARGTVVPGEAMRQASLVRGVRRWIGGLEDRGQGGAWRLAFRINEPFAIGDLPEFGPPDDDVVWTLTFHLQSLENERVLLDGEDVWALRGSSASVDGQPIEAPQELLLAELGRASRIYRPIERALEDSSPSEIELDTAKAYDFLREVRPLLMEQGFGVIAPEWWDSPSARLGARLMLSPHEAALAESSGSGPGSISESRMGLQALVSYQWRLAVGDVPLTLAEFEKLAAQRSPLVRVDGRWVEIRPEDIEHAVNFLREHPGGEIRMGEALRMAYGLDMGEFNLPIAGIDASGWVAEFLGQEPGESSFHLIDAPQGFHGELRPYQRKGLSWLVFLDRVGLGPCLADDMGLGKTIQLLALLVHEREEALPKSGTSENGHPEDPHAHAVDPTLIVVPMSVVGNWVRESKRFAPSLRVMVHHGVERATGDEFFKMVGQADLVITTYALAHRDHETIECVRWGRVVLDEAQNIKNPSAKQSQAVRSLDAPRRVALTGTPLENRLSELWSIIDFCNPGFLGTAGEFRRTFGIPIERYRDKRRANQLRSLVRPFILRRLKTDPLVISDLPEKLETKEYCRLTSEQAELYESCVRTMLGEVERTEGIRRRGIVLTALIRLKQVCNHPSLLDKSETDAVSAGLPTRSGKCIRLLEMLEEVVASTEQALVFTQFRQMGHLLAAMIRHTFDRDVLFLHGGTPQGQREAMIDRFQKADGTCPIFILSLKAGGVGLNLTAASHVFHFDRWWNPAVENQATDRAFRIGQKRTVNVHKFVVTGTLEERIDQMIESKIALAEDVIGSGEEWLTELSTQQLRDVLELRPDALGDE